LARQLLSPAIAQKVGASDLVQETCLEAMRDFGTARVRDVAGMQAWLTTLLANNVKDWQRKYRSSKKRDCAVSDRSTKWDLELTAERLPSSVPTNHLPRAQSKLSPGIWSSKLLSGSVGATSRSSCGEPRSGNPGRKSLGDWTARKMLCGCCGSVPSLG